jgi:hypothetical protein
MSNTLVVTSDGRAKWLSPEGILALREKAKALYAGGMGCNCDLDRWQPEHTTGHSWVCRIHKAAIDEGAKP